jgi:hypothetical protein
MQHSVNNIGAQYEELSTMRGDADQFIAKDFKQFALANMQKYGIIDVGYDLLVSTWHSDNLIDAYRKTIQLKQTL